ncbi:MAG TPA: hypothetical protein ACQGQI_10010, partial [Xylella sp.]
TVIQHVKEAALLEPVMDLERVGLPLRNVRVRARISLTFSMSRGPLLHPQSPGWRGKYGSVSTIEV